MNNNSHKKNFQRELGNRILSIRLSKGMSLREVAQNCDLDYSDIGKFEKGDINFKVQTLYELARGLEVHPRELLNFEIVFNDVENLK